MTAAVENPKPESKARSARDKAQVTDTVAYGIIDAEAAARKEKTARLRALRQKQENVAPPSDESGTGAKRKRTATRKRKA